MIGFAGLFLQSVKLSIDDMRWVKHRIVLVVTIVIFQVESLHEIVVGFG